MRQQETASDFIASFSRQRQQLLSRTAQVLPTSPDAAQSFESIALTQCLVSSLEQLKAAEEELRSQHRELVTYQAEAERKLTYWRAMFDLAPTPLMVTTQDGTIREGNQALAALLTRDVYHLDGTPAATLVPAEYRQDFRSQLKRVVEVGGVDSWSIVVERRTREPAPVTVTIRLIPSALTGTMALYWALREAR